MNLSKSMKKTAGAAALSLTILLSSLALTPSTYAATPVAVGGKAIVTNTDGDTIRVREGAGTNYGQVAEVYEGQTVSVLAGPSKDSNGKVWYKVQGPGGTGWVSSGFLEGKEGAPAQPKAPAAPKLDGFAKVANTDGDPLRVRAAANTSGGVIATLDAGATVAIKAGPVTDKSGTSWYQVSANGTTGWVMAQYLAQAKAPVQPAAAPPASAPAQRPAAAISGFAKVANTDGDPLRMRSSASRNASVITNLSPGTSVAVKQGPVDKDGVAWYQVSAGGTTGWVMGQYLAQAKSPVEPVVASKPAAPAPAPNVAPAKPAAPAPAAVAPAAEAPRSGTARGAEQPAAPAASSRADSIVNTAMKYVGYRYRFGGSSPSGFDCSGFVYYVMKSVGMPVARTIPGQIGSGSRVSSKDLQPGDLVFFSNTYKRGLSHAGIYIGNGKFVHAQNESTGVVVSNLWSSYWAAHYTTAVRPGR
ncbi:MAG TPA: SH3 domain-containing protein [Chloroflexia bacterium]